MLFECRYCGREFEKTHNRQMYCSKECSTKAKREQDLTHWKTWRSRNWSKYVEKRKNYVKRKALRILNGDENRLKQYIERTKHEPWLTREIECQQLGLGSYSEAMYNCFKRAKGKCELTGRITNNLQIHHLNGYHWSIADRCDLDNLIALDENIHREFHRKYGRMNNTRLQFEEFKKEYLPKVTLDYWM